MKNSIFIKKKFDTTIDKEDLKKYRQNFVKILRECFIVSVGFFRRHPNYNGNTFILMESWRSLKKFLVPRKTKSDKKFTKEILWSQVAVEIWKNRGKTIIEDQNRSCHKKFFLSWQKVVMVRRFEPIFDIWLQMLSIFVVVVTLDPHVSLCSWCVGRKKIKITEQETLL